MLIKKAAGLRESDVTPKETFLKRRDFLAVAGSAAVGVATNGFGLAGSPDAFARFISDEIAKWKQVIASAGIRIE